MTLLRSSEQVEVIDAPSPSSESDAVAVELEETLPARRRSDWRWWVAVVVAVAIVIGLTVALFQGPVQNIWYHNRQHQLAADMNQAREGVAPGQAVALLQIPRLGVNVVVVEGDNAERLRNGPGHRVGTPRPGQVGNSVIAGHQGAWGGPFSQLHTLKKGDLIAVQTRAKKTVVYKVTATENVGGGESRFIPQTKDHRLTLVTGRGGSLSDDRIVVTAVSGTPSKSKPKLVEMNPVSSGGSAIFNLTMLVALIALALAIATFFILRRRSIRSLTIGIVIAPLVVLGALCLLLTLDLLLPPLA